VEAILIVFSAVFKEFDLLGSDSEFGLAVDMKRALLLELLFS